LPGDVGPRIRDHATSSRKIGTMQRKSIAATNSVHPTTLCNLSSQLLNHVQNYSFNSTMSLFYDISPGDISWAYRVFAS